MPRDAVSRTANVEGTGRHKWVKQDSEINDLCTQRNLFEILLNQTKIKLYLPFSDSFGTKRKFVWFQTPIGKTNKQIIHFPFSLFEDKSTLPGKADEGKGADDPG